MSKQLHRCFSSAWLTQFMEGQSNFPFVLQQHIPTCWEVDPSFLWAVLIQLGHLELPGINSWNGILLLWLGSFAGSSLRCVVGIMFFLYNNSALSVWLHRKSWWHVAAKIQGKGGSLQVHLLSHFGEERTQIQVSRQKVCGQKNTGQGRRPSPGSGPALLFVSPATAENILYRVQSWLSTNSKVVFFLNYAESHFQRRQISKLIVKHL